MRWIVAACLLGLPFPDDDEAAKLLEEVRRSVLEARSLHLEVEVSMGQGQETAFSLSGTIKLKGSDRWAMTFTAGESLIVERPETVTILFDGRRVYSSGTGVKSLFGYVAPGEAGGEVRKAVLTALFLPTMIAHGNTAEKRMTQPPVVGAVKDGGMQRVGGRRVRVIAYTLKYAWNNQTLPVKMYVNPETKAIVRRDISIQGFLWKETYGTFVLNPDLPDSDFAFQSSRRLARAQSKLLARSIALFGRFTGRHPRSLEDLTRKPPSLEKGVFWPEGGFLLGKDLPKDPWGRSFQFRRREGVLSVVCLGADGKEGGKHDEEDHVVPIPPVTRQAVGAVTPRLKDHYSARVAIKLLTTTVEAFRESYGELPRKKAALWDRPEWAEVWPAGGWLPEGRMPLDPWGEPYRMISDEHFVRVQVRDPRSRVITLRLLTGEERKKLEETAKPKLTPEERKELHELVVALGDLSPVRREQAHLRLQNWGYPALPFLEERAKTEKDPEAIGRLSMLRRSIRAPVPAWRTELASLSRMVRGDGVETGTTASNERNASTTLKTFASAQADFRANDRDGNRTNDFWTGDVAGLFCMTNALTRGNKDDPIRLIELSAALADAAPLEDGTAGGEYRGIEAFGVREAKAGYLFKAMERDTSVTPPVEYRQDTRGQPNLGNFYNRSRFGICAYPEEYGIGGIRTFIMSEMNTVYSKDTGGEPVSEWPSHAELKEEWSKLD